MGEINRKNRLAFWPAVDVVHFLLALLPVAAWLECVVRGGQCILWLRDYLLEALTSLTLFFTLFAVGGFIIHLHPYGLFALLAAAVAALLWWRLRTIRQAGGPSGLLWRRALVRSLLRLMLKTTIFLLGVLGLSFWFLLATWKPAWGLGTGLGAAAVYFWLRRKDHPWRRHAWLGLGLTGAVLVVAQGLLAFFQTPALDAQSWFPDAAYDSLLRPDGSLVVSSGRRNFYWAYLVPAPMRSRKIDQSHNPQRLVLDPNSGRVYMNNYEMSNDRAVTVLAQNQARYLAVPGCQRPIDLRLFENDLLVACEISGTVHRIDPATGQVREVWQLPPMLSSLAVDRTRRRMYVTGELLSRRLSVIDPAGKEIIKSTPLGVVNWGIEVDEATGRVWVARPVVGEVFVFDAQLNLEKRIATGLGSRDVALDAARRRLLIGNYMEGTVSVADLDALRVTESLRLRWWGLARRLRGVDVAHDGSWWLADARGVWRIR